MLKFGALFAVVQNSETPEREKKTAGSYLKAVETRLVTNYGVIDENYVAADY